MPWAKLLEIVRQNFFSFHIEMEKQKKHKQTNLPSIIPLFSLLTKSSSESSTENDNWEILTLSCIMLKNGQTDF